MFTLSKGEFSIYFSFTQRKWFVSVACYFFGFKVLRTDFFVWEKQVGKDWKKIGFAATDSMDRVDQQINSI